MIRFVVDTSMVVCWFLPNQATRESDRLLSQLGSGHSAIAPCIWPSEVTNSLRSAERRRILKPAETLAIVNALRALPVFVEHLVPARVFDSARELAAQYDISVYDATYLDLAIREQLPLATVDKQLRNAARKAGVKPA